ncbi:EAL domain-containing protein [Nitrosomonas marina]|uniref:Response regulator receiver modulated diguanylate cyclase/phosphodiesterase n=1 Tax=Nitrosomonas marina TaxID=917 RepID=A0A1H8AHY4_9PROT|nr:EAL domain-containing protein [Nitrosomonas marina]SEM70330.1 response regulator receiver modulated diguanylate cyclase/phosphodiesterase [Nitrosomonas marina]
MTSDSFKVLLADDDATIRYLMQIALERAGLIVSLAQNGEEAIRLFNESPADMVLLDVEMPGKSGYEVCSYLRKKVGSELPIVMVTGMDDVQSIDHAFDLGATDFIVKPINWSLIPYHILYLKRAYLNLIELKHANARSKAIFNTIPDAMFILNENGMVIEVLSHTPQTSCLTIQSGKVLNQSFPEQIVKKYLDASLSARKQQRTEHFEFQLKFDQQIIRYYECRIVTIDLNETLCLVQDITDRINSENKIYRLAYFDGLTGLPNRQAFMKRLKREISRAQFAHNQLAVLFLDLDGFKCINDAMGHNTGDRMLQSAADRLQKDMRTTDFLAINPQYVNNTPTAELARIGGDEFTIIISNFLRTEDALMMAHRIREAMQQPFHIDNQDVVLTASIGIALYPDDGSDAETLLKHADTAMNHAKNEGRNNCQFYSSTLTRQAEKRLQLENGMRRALLQHEFYLTYQPQLDIASGQFKSVEALIRWQHPTQGQISPGDFISLAEENGLIIPIGEWVLRTACIEAMKWKNRGLHSRISVNLSPMQLKNPDLVKNILNILVETNFSPDALILEVTESALMNCNQSTLNTLHSLRRHGIEISLDDFGTGYSSMNYLKHLPITNIKVDKIFVNGMLDDDKSLAIIRSIISLSKNLGFTVTAEGIEFLEQADLLRTLGCDYLQGHYFSKPVRAVEIEAIFTKQHPTKAAYTLHSIA